jgi:hypothetical protein
MHSVIDRLVEILSAANEVSVPVSNLGSKRPSAGNDLPAVSISLGLDPEKSPAIGRYIRSGDSPARSSAIIEVKSMPDAVEAFSADLKSLRISPLPLRRNPASVGREFSEDDLQVRNVTDPANSIGYQMVSSPARKEEFKLDVTSARIEFGAAQTPGEKLEITHWTVTWRDEILADRFIGSMTLEIWAHSFNQTEGIARSLQRVIKSHRPLLREKGFLKLHPSSLSTTEQLSLDPPAGSAIPVWRQRLEYKFAFEVEDGGELSGGVPIRRINVEMNEQGEEEFSIR